MAGTRPLTDDEILLVLPQFKKLRDKALFITGIKTGFRISEILSLLLKDVYQHSTIIDRLRVERKSMKGNITSRDTPIHRELKKILLDYVNELIKEHGNNPYMPLFPSRKRSKIGELKSIGIWQAWHVLTTAFDGAKLTGFLATHSMRKTFGNKVHKKLKGDIRQTQIAMGHAHPTTTMRYLPPDQPRIDAAILDDDESEDVA